MERRGRILVIDDDPFVLRAMQRMLREHEVVVAEAASAAMAVLDQDDRYDLILTDLMMPGMTGVDLYERLLAGRGADVRRVVFLTGGALDSQVRAFLESVPNESLEKPIAASALRAFVQRRLSNDPITKPLASRS